MAETDARAVLVAQASSVARRGRRRANTVGGEKRGKTIQLKLTDAEDAEVRARAEARGLTPQALLMQATLAGGLEAAARYEQLREELGMALRLLASVSTNVNQLARQANTVAGGVEGVSPVTGRQLAAALAAVERAAGQVTVVASATVRPAARRARAGQ